MTLTYVNPAVLNTPSGFLKSTLSPLTLGCWSSIGDSNWGRQNEADSLAVFDLSLELGIQSFDTAPMYGDGASEELLGRAFRGRRESVTIATKVSGLLTGPKIRESCEASLRRLQSDYIDLFQIHWPDPETPIRETAEALLQLRDQGKIRAIGVCNFGVQDLSAALKVMPIVTNQLPYNLLWRGLEFGVLPLCRDHGVDVMSYSTLMQGLLTGKFFAAEEVPAGRARTRHFAAEGRPAVRHGEGGHEEATFTAIENIRSICKSVDIPMSVAALAAILEQPGVCTVIAGARNVNQMHENARVLKTRLGPGTIASLMSATEALKMVIGPEIDPWAPQSRIK